MATRGLNDAAMPLVVSSSNQPTPEDFSLHSAILGRGGLVTFRWPGWDLLPGWGGEGGEAGAQAPPWGCKGKELGGAAANALLFV